MTLQVINSPFTEQQVKALNELLPTLTPQQKIWLTGYLTAASTEGPAAVQEPAQAPQQTKDITILFASQTGNSQKVAKKLGAALEDPNHQVTVTSMGDYKVNSLKKADHLFIIASTHGEGEPPDNAISFY